MDTKIIRTYQTIIISVAKENYIKNFAKVKIKKFSKLLKSYYHDISSNLEVKGTKILTFLHIHYRTIVKSF